MTSAPRIVRSCEELREALRSQADGSVGLVPTMGALHEGHASLVRRAAADNGTVVVSVFVNPLQFENLGDCEDYRRYPRDLDADVAVLDGLGVDIVFAPSEAEMYPEGLPMVWVRTGHMGSTLEGASRPGHFDGVATVVAKLFNLVQPDRAYFGQKDAQQVAILRRMVADLNFPVELIAIPTIRGADGLADSSRNQHLDEASRTQALALPRALETLRARAAAGEALEVEAIRRELGASEGVRLDHLEIVNPSDLAPLSEAELSAPLTRTALVVAAIHVGGTRLIDNVELVP